MTRWIVVLAAALACLASGDASAAADGDVGALLGVWRVTIESSSRPRTLVVRTVTRTEGSTVTLDGLYGYSDSKKPTKVSVTVTSTPDGRLIELETPAKSKIAVRSVAADEMRGTFATAKRTEAVVLNRDRVTAVSAAFPPADRLTVIYVSATN
jgi:hypothetical protein